MILTASQPAHIFWTIYMMVAVIFIIWLPIHIIRKHKSHKKQMIQLLQEQNKLLKELKEKEENSIPFFFSIPTKQLTQKPYK